MNVLESSTKIAFKNVLFLTDFSEASQAAMQYAAMLARHYGATFYPAHVYTPTPPMYMEGFALTQYFNVVEDQTRKKLTQLVDPLGVTPHVLVGEGLIEDAIERWTAIH